MRNNERWIDLAVLDFLQQRFDVAMHVRLAGLQGQTFVDERADGEVITHAHVHAGY